MHRRSHRWLILLLVCILPLKAAIAAGGFGCHGLRVAFAGATAAAFVMGMPADHHASVGADAAAAAHGAHGHGDPHADATAGSADLTAALADPTAASAESPSASPAQPDSPASPAKLACPACAMGCSAPVLPAGGSACLPPHAAARAWLDADAPAPPEHVPPGLERPPRAA